MLNLKGLVREIGPGFCNHKTLPGYFEHLNKRACKYKYIKFNQPGSRMDIKIHRGKNKKFVYILYENASGGEQESFELKSKSFIKESKKKN